MISRTSRSVLVVVLLLSALLGVAHSAEVLQKKVCQMGELRRYISLRVYEGDGAPCDVYYEKPFEEAYANVEWSADNDAAYCESQFLLFVEKLETMGWVCSTE